jgi:hypothetical protein
MYLQLDVFENMLSGTVIEQRFNIVSLSAIVREKEHPYFNLYRRKNFIIATITVTSICSVHFHFILISILFWISKTF